MSDVLIRGIEMPTGNDELRLIIRSNGQVIISHKTYYEEAEAVPVPPHGRLINADLLIKVLKEKATNPLNQETKPYSWAFAYECLADVVGDMPTIIPAEPPKEE